MPYIPQEERYWLDPHIEHLAENIRLRSVNDAKQFAGLLNYTVSRLLALSLPEKRYWAMALGVGTLVCAIFEFYRRYAAPYEDGAIAKHGDLKEYTT